MASAARNAYSSAYFTIIDLPDHRRAHRFGDRDRRERRSPPEHLNGPAAAAALMVGVSPFVK
ncbi:MAG: hypothetical protein OEX04_13605 [Acidimicrobiia bacterium]|nr:hypothetical protein [Acidimicrobiia bacterium]MDH4308505.1 hypothetical protein [Acidimicrobiia bacterium]MDH5294919.1 hypothetical protein [Acidimicrobiia bacterium]